MYGRGEGPGGCDAHPGDHCGQHRVLARGLGGGPGRELDVLPRSQRGQQNGNVMYICMYVSMLYVCMYVGKSVGVDMYYVCIVQHDIHVSMYVSMYVCMYVCMWGRV